LKLDHSAIAFDGALHDCPIDGAPIKPWNIAGAIWESVMTLFAKVFSTPTLVQMVVVLTAMVAMKALRVHYDF